MRVRARVRGAARSRPRRKSWARRANSFTCGAFAEAGTLAWQGFRIGIGRNGVNRGKRAAKECSAGRGSNTGKTDSGCEAQERIQEEARAPRDTSRRGVCRRVV